MNFKIDPRIEDLLPRLSSEEFANLGRLIETDGHVDPLVVLNIMGERVLGDGHNRLKICQQKGIKYTAREIKIPSWELALQWVIDNQLGRRNLTDERRAYYQGKEYLHKKQQHVGQTVSDGQNDHPGQTVAQTIAEKHGVSEKTVRRNAAFAEALDKIGEWDPVAKETILSGLSDLTRQAVIDTNAMPHDGQLCLDHGYVTLDAARPLLLLKVFNRVATRNPFGDLPARRVNPSSHTWYDHMAKLILWKPRLARTEQEIAYEVDSALYDLYQIEELYGHLPKDESDRLAEENLRDPDRRKGLVCPEYWWARLWFQMKPDFTRLSASDREMIEAATDRYLGTFRSPAIDQVEACP